MPRTAYEGQFDENGPMIFVPARRLGFASEGNCRADCSWHSYHRITVATKPNSFVGLPFSNDQSFGLKPLQWI